MARKVSGNIQVGVVGMGEQEEISDGYIYVDDSFVAPVADEDVSRDTDGNKLYTIKERKILDGDGRARNVMRARVALTPAICELCGTEMVRNYSILSDSDKKIAEAKVAAHKKAIHYTHQARVINEKQMKETSNWPPKA